MRRSICLALVLTACVHAHPRTAPLPVAPPPPSAEDVRVFLDQVDRDLRRLWVARDRAGWVNENFLTEDTDALAAQGEAATAEYMGRTIPASRRFGQTPMPPELWRSLYLLSISQTIPAPADPKKREELAGIESWMQSEYGKGTYCPPDLHGKCLHLDDLERVLRTSHDYDQLVEAWVGWHAIAKPMRPKYERYVQLSDEGARQIGFSDVGALWKSMYDMPPEAFEQEEQRLWDQVKPLYQKLHCYVRRRLSERYGAARVPPKGPIPVPATGNMWGQEWTNLYDLVAPYPREPSLDVSKTIAKKRLSPTEMVKIGEGFYTSLGFPPLPKSFWDRSLFTRPRDREVVCHASAWDVQWNGDVRLKMCIEPTEDDLVTIHHELGHDYYFLSYDTLPILFQQGANGGFQEGIGDTIALSVTPDYLHERGLLPRVAHGEKARLNELMKRALQKVAFLPFGYVIDKWRWDVFSGKIDPAHYNQAFWDLRLKYGGEAPPVPRTEADFDPGAKYHIVASYPYAFYFLATIYQFQFHRALCQTAGFKGPLDECSIYGSKPAGEKLRAMLALGGSRPWQDAMELLAGRRDADATAIVDYFKPLSDWLDAENRGQACGW